MEELVIQVKLNRVFNEIQDVLDKHNVELCVGCRPAVHRGDTLLFFDSAFRTTAYDKSKPPLDWDAFLAEATDVFVTKDRDYQSRFMRALCDVEKDPRTIWAWEAEKKLDRIRTWTANGKLEVKCEGVKDSVVDLFNYTVQYSMYRQCMQLKLNPFLQLNEHGFFVAAAVKTPGEWLKFIAGEGLLSTVEFEVVSTIFKYMGTPNG